MKNLYLLIIITLSLNLQVLGKTPMSFLKDNPSSTLKSKINNGILEGLNSKIQLAKRRARGYRNINNFINMIYFTCGKLKFDYPLYLT